MCNNADREKAMVTIATDAAGKPTVWCDPCLAQIVTALNEGGLPTVASCCGHGTSVGSVALADGRWVVVMEAEDWAAFDNRRALTDAERLEYTVAAISDNGAITSLSGESTVVRDHLEGDLELYRQQQVEAGCDPQRIVIAQRPIPKWARS